MLSTIPAKVGIAPAGVRPQRQTRVGSAKAIVGTPVQRTSRAFGGFARHRPSRRNTVVQVVANDGTTLTQVCI